MRETDKNVPLFVAFTGNEVGKTHLVFPKRRFQSFRCKILRVVSHWGKSCFSFQLPRDKRNFCNFRAFYVYSCCPSRKLPRTLLNYASTLNVREVMEFYNLGNQSFETGFKLK